MSPVRCYQTRFHYRKRTICVAVWARSDAAKAPAVHLTSKRRVLSMTSHLNDSATMIQRITKKRRNCAEAEQSEMGQRLAKIISTFRSVPKILW